jgi:hypothetical protein
LVVLAVALTVHFFFKFEAGIVKETLPEGVPVVRTKGVGMVKPESAEVKVTVTVSRGTGVEILTIAASPTAASVRTLASILAAVEGFQSDPALE